MAVIDDGASRGKNAFETELEKAPGVRPTGRVLALGGSWDGTGAERR